MAKPMILFSARIADAVRLSKLDRPKRSGDTFTKPKGRERQAVSSLFGKPIEPKCFEQVRSLSHGVIDFSPYWRAAGFAIAAVMVDGFTELPAERSPK